VVPGFLSDLLPPAVATCEVRTDGALEETLFPEERSAVAGSAEHRQREFGTGRACARAALVSLGVPAGAIPRGPRGAPQWPVGVVGSITHCAGYRASAVARHPDFTVLGIDAEPDEPVPHRLLARITGEPERAHLAELTRRHPDVHWDRLLFSAKESVYKAWYPLTGEWLNFLAAQLRFDPAGTFAARILVPEQTPEGRSIFYGRWLARDGLVITAIAE
jgi:4'-phosphopantetheinyl transferase EntD